MSPELVGADAGSPRGGWVARVRRPRGVVEETMHFTSDGRVFLNARGAGQWFRRAAGRFTFTLAEPLLDDSQTTLVGWVDVSQDAVQDGDTFASSGVTVVRDADGVESVRMDVTIEARRAPAPAPAHAGVAASTVSSS